MGEGGDSTLVDQSSNSNNGTITGATRSSDNPGNITNTSISNTTTESLLSHLQTIGSKIQRLESKEEALMDQTTAQEAVRSSIEDADFAEEQMELIKAQIMQQTANCSAISSEYCSKYRIEFIRGLKRKNSLSLHLYKFFINFCKFQSR